MSGKSKKSSRAIDRPFAATIWKQARTLANQYQIIFQSEDGQWFGRGLELSHVMADGKTPARCLEATREAMAVAVGYLLEEGKSPPSPANSGARTQQVNVRLTADEKALLEITARHNGFSGMSDFIRAAALDAAN